MKTLFLAFISAFIGSCSAEKYPPSQVVKATAYTHTEKDSLPFGKKNAIGTNLLFGNIRSVSCDWSFLAVDTEFRIEGQPYIYRVDDYGRALVGTETIDLYFPTKKQMKEWGVKKVRIIITKRGDELKSWRILQSRKQFAHVRRMILSIDQG